MAAALNKSNSSLSLGSTNSTNDSTSALSQSLPRQSPSTASPPPHTIAKSKSYSSSRITALPTNQHGMWATSMDDETHGAVHYSSTPSSPQSATPLCSSLINQPVVMSASDEITKKKVAKYNFSFLATVTCVWVNHRKILNYETQNLNNHRKRI